NTRSACQPRPSAHRSTIPSQQVRVGHKYGTESRGNRRGDKRARLKSFALSFLAYWDLYGHLKNSGIRSYEARFSKIRVTTTEIKRRRAQSYIERKIRPAVSFPSSPVPQTG